MEYFHANHQKYCLVPVYDEMDKIYLKMETFWYYHTMLRLLNMAGSVRPCWEADVWRAGDGIGCIPSEDRSQTIAGASSLGDIGVEVGEGALLWLMLI
ncbi:hypothetical protein [Luxibacter massiliensis]|uniref:hypothetical protein n=1 Tax=Luxibacter massiliensis TaxID=2219695 RepID=UPI0013DF1716|nr:hypothetical protein [Luxibacter massiliensis]